MSRIGDVLAEKYQLVGLLGEGGMGSVFEAEHQELGKHVAIKLLLPELARDSEAVARFTREARAAAAIGHRSIIDVYDIGTAPDGSLFLVMESLQGENLSELMRRTGALDVPVAAFVVASVLSALDAAHSTGIVHRDLKPENVFLVQTGLTLPEVKLLDFGISKMVDPANPEERLTRTGAVMGTPYYMAPEQAEGRTDLDHRLDIYAVGVILYECLTGRVPFTADNTLALIRKILNESVAPPRELRPDLPGELEAIVLRAMSRDRDARYQTAAEMLEAIVPFMDEVGASRVPLPAPTGAESTALAIGGEGGGEDLATGPTLASGVSGDAGTDMAWTGDQPLEMTRASSSNRAFIVAGIVVVVAAVVAGVYLSVSTDGLPQDEPMPQTTPASAGKAPAAIDETPPVDPVRPDAAAPAMGEQTVTITLEGVPDGGTVFLENARVDGTALELQRSSALRRVHVEQDGREVWSQMVSPREDHNYRVEVTSGEREPTPSVEERRVTRHTTRIEQSGSSTSPSPPVVITPATPDVAITPDPPPVKITPAPPAPPRPPPTAPTKAGQLATDDGEFR